MGAPYRQASSGAYFTGEQHLLMDTVGASRVTGRTGVIYCHARSATAYEPLDTRTRPAVAASGYDYAKLCERLVQTGLPLISCDLSGMTHWGNPTALSRIGSAFTFLQSKLGARSDRVLLAGTSMGVLTALNYARANQVLVKAVLGMFPALDWADTGLGAYTTEMDTAYGGNAARLAAAGTSNPATYAATLNVPVYLLYSTGDAVARPAPVTTFASTAPQVTTATISSAGAHVAAAITDAELNAGRDWLAARA